MDRSGIRQSVFAGCMLVAVAILGLAGCGQAATNAPLGLLSTVTPLGVPTATATLAAPTNAAKPTAKPKATPKPTPKPTQKPKPKPTKKPSTSGGGGYYKPPGWDGYGDVDCPDFSTHAQAQSFFKGTGGSRTNDPYRLDADHDGIACESLP